MPSIRYGRILGIAVTVLGLLASASVEAQGAKITWDKNGKPIIEKSDKPVRGCNYNPFADTNTTKCEEK